MRFIFDKNITANIFEIQMNDSIMCRYFGVGFIDYILVINNFKKNV